MTTAVPVTTTRAKSVPVLGPLTVAMTVSAGGSGDAGLRRGEAEVGGETMNCCPALFRRCCVPSPPPWQPAMKQATSAAQPLGAPG